MNDLRSKSVLLDPVVPTRFDSAARDDCRPDTPHFNSPHSLTTILSLSIKLEQLSLGFGALVLFHGREEIPQ